MSSSFIKKVIGYSIFLKNSVANSRKDVGVFKGDYPLLEVFCNKKHKKGEGVGRAVLLCRYCDTVPIMM